MFYAFENGDFDIIFQLQHSGHSRHVGDCIANVATILGLIEAE